MENGPDKDRGGGRPAYPTASLLVLASEGDRDAQNRLVDRYWNVLRRWAHGRLPRNARERADTEDLVQITLLKTLKRLGTIDVSRKGQFTSYLHQVLTNQIRDEIRRAARRPSSLDTERELASPDASPFRVVSGREFMDRYRDALAELPEDGRRAIVMRLELGHSYEEIAEAIGSPSPNAARMLVSRSVSRLATVLRERGKG